MQRHLHYAQKRTQKSNAYAIKKKKILNPFEKRGETSHALKITHFPCAQP